MPAGLPYILDIAHDGGIADVHGSGEAALHLPLVAVITMPIEFESQRKRKIEHLNVFHWRTPSMEANGICLGSQRDPVGRRNRGCFLPKGPEPRGGGAAGPPRHNTSCGPIEASRDRYQRMFKSWWPQWRGGTFPSARDNFLQRYISFHITAALPVSF